MRCLPYAHAVTGSIARLDTHTLALPITNRRGDACVAVADIKNRLELCCHILASVRSLPVARGKILGLSFYTQIYRTGFYKGNIESPSDRSFSCVLSGEDVRALPFSCPWHSTPRCLRTHRHWPAHRSPRSCLPAYRSCVNVAQLNWAFIGRA